MKMGGIPGPQVTIGFNSHCGRYLQDSRTCVVEAGKHGLPGRHERPDPKLPVFGSVVPNANNLLVLQIWNGWEWGNGIIINNHYGSCPHSLRLALVSLGHA